MITIQYLGRFRDELLAQEALEGHTPATTGELLALLRSRGPHWQEALAEGKVFGIAINAQLVKGDAPIPAGAHVALLPPVTGG